VFGGNKLGDEYLRTESIISSLCVGNKLNKWETVQDFDVSGQKIRVLNFPHSLDRIFFRAENVLKGRYIC
jgi:hypothetical protein